jgi:hypothetical protein
MGDIKNTKNSVVLDKSSAINKSAVLILFCLLSGCAYFPPKPTECTGPYTPINVPVEKDAVLNKAAIDSSAASKTGDLDKTLHSVEGAIDGK